MTTKKTVFLIDVDNTLIDTDKITSTWKKNFGNEFIGVYEKVKKSSGFLDIGKLAKLLSIDKEYFYKTNFRKLLFPNALESLKILKKIGNVIIFSLGDSTYQKIKIKKSGIEKTIGKNNIILTKNKDLEIKDLVLKLAKKYTKIVVIDDRTDILEIAESINPKITTIWVKQGKYKNIIPKKLFSLTFIANSTFEAATFISSLVKTIKNERFGRQVSIVRGINKNQTDQLIKHTRDDILVNKFTHDKERFKNKKDFESWIKLGKTVFTLIDSNQRLLGIFWFAKEKYDKFDYTFGIRIYPPARGKGFATKFMKTVFNDFDPKDKKSYWLSTDKENLIAKDIYNKFGFKEKEINKDSIVMVKG